MKLAVMFCIIFFSGCGVEVGNPNGETGDGTVKIAVDTGTESGLNLTAGSGGKRFDLYLDSVQILGYDEAQEFSTSLQLSVSEVNLFAGEGQVEVANDRASIGTYDTLVLNLREANPFRYLPDGENERPVRFEDPSYRSIYISEGFSIEQDGEAEILIDLDLASSLTQSNDDFVFKPRVESYRRKFAVSYEGNVGKENGVTVCAYLYNPWKKPRPPRPHFDDGGFHPRPPPPPPGADGQKGMVFKTKEEVVFDETTNCSNAFKTTTVQENGTFTFPRLKPGTYTFRAFFTDDTYEDVAEDVLLEPDLDSQELQKASLNPYFYTRKRGRR